MATPQSIAAQIDAGFQDLPDDPDQPDSAASEGASESPSPEPAEAQSTSPTEAPSAEPSQEPIDPKRFHDPRWLSKHKGSLEAADQAAWEANNRASLFKRERDDFERQLAESREKLKQYEQAKPQEATPAPAPVEPDLAADLAQIDDALRAVETNWKANQQALKDGQAQHERIQAEIQGCIRALANPNLDIDKADDARRKLADLYPQVNQWRSYLQGLSATDSAQLQEYRLLYQQRKVLDRTSKLESATRQAEAARREAQDAQSTQAYAHYFHDTLKRIATTGDDTIPEDELDDFREEAVALAHTLSSLPATEADIVAFIEKCKERYIRKAKKYAERKASVDAPAKASDLKVSAPSGKAAVAPVEKRRAFSKRDEMDRYIEDQWDRI